MCQAQTTGQRLLQGASPPQEFGDMAGRALCDSQNRENGGKPSPFYFTAFLFPSASVGDAGQTFLCGLSSMGAPAPAVSLLTISFGSCCHGMGPSLSPAPAAQDGMQALPILPGAGGGGCQQLHLQLLVEQRHVDITRPTSWIQLCQVASLQGGCV